MANVIITASLTPININKEPVESCPSVEMRVSNIDPKGEKIAIEIPKVSNTNVLERYSISRADLAYILHNLPQPSPKDVQRPLLSRGVARC